MTNKLLIAPEAERDITDAYRWYEARRAGLGEEFLTSVEASIARVSREPALHPIVYESYRRALARRFPYAIFFEYTEGTVTIYAVFHTSRDPAKWRERLP